VADAMTDQLVKSCVAPREKFSTIYSGMEIAPFLKADQHREAARRELGFSDEHVVVGKIARLFHLKGHDYLIEAASRVVQQHPHVRFLLVGDGILRSQLERRIDQLRMKSFFHFVGLVEPEQIPRMISAMDVLAHCSLREGLARALPQALIAGKPAISFDIDGAREVVVTGETGYLLPPASVDALTDAISALATNRQDRERFGNAGRERCRERFHHESMTRSLRQLYEKVLAGSATLPGREQTR
jgi:glycosyltransferase involved in cell wall biosynthesis